MNLARTPSSVTPYKVSRSLMSRCFSRTRPFSRRLILDRDARISKPACSAVTPAASRKRRSWLPSSTRSTAASTDDSGRSGNGSPSPGPTLIIVCSRADELGCAPATAPPGAAPILARGSRRHGLLPAAEDGGVAARVFGEGALHEPGDVVDDDLGEALLQPVQGRGHHLIGVDLVNREVVTHRGGTRALLQRRPLGVDLAGPPLPELADPLGPDAPIGAGNKNHATFDIHEKTFFVTGLGVNGEHRRLQMLVGGVAGHQQAVSHL